MPGGPIVPISVILSWPTANTINPETIGNFWWIWNAITMIIITLVVIIRIWVKQKAQGGFGSDDYFMFFGYLATVSTSITACLITTIYKWDRHAWDTAPYLSKIIQGKQAILALMISTLLANIGVKISILLLIKRLIVRTSKYTLYWTIWFTIAFVILSNSVFLIGIWVQCFPLNALWNEMDPFWVLSHQHEFRCHREAISAVVSGALNLLQDFMIATIPILVFRNLQIPIAKKASLITLFAVGYL
jgi:hypothetical protein